MAEDASLRKLVEFIFTKKVENAAEMPESNSSIPNCVLPNDFYTRLQAVLSMKKFICSSEWENYFPDSFESISSTDMYLIRVMIACLGEHNSYKNIFEGFIGVCALVNFFNEVTLSKTGMNFCDKSTGIVMEFYEDALEISFSELGGVQKLIEYIRDHQYLTWDWNWKNISSPGGPTVPANFMTREKKKIDLESNERVLTHDVAETNKTAALWLQNVLSSTSVDLPTSPIASEGMSVPMKEELVGNHSVERIEATVKSVDLDVNRQGCSSSNSDSKINHTVNQNVDEARYENIIQAVTTFNHSRKSDQTNSDKGIQQKMDGILVYLKNNIKSLSELLEDSD